MPAVGVVPPAAVPGGWLPAWIQQRNRILVRHRAEVQHLAHRVRRRTAPTAPPTPAPTPSDWLAASIHQRWRILTRHYPEVQHPAHRVRRVPTPPRPSPAPTQIWLAAWIAQRHRILTRHLAPVQHPAHRVPIKRHVLPVVHGRVDQISWIAATLRNRQQYQWIWNRRVDIRVPRFRRMVPTVITPPGGSSTLAAVLKNRMLSRIVRLWHDVPRHPLVRRSSRPRFPLVPDIDQTLWFWDKPFWLSVQTHSLDAHFGSGLLAADTYATIGGLTTTSTTGTPVRKKGRWVSLAIQSDTGSAVPSATCEVEIRIDDAVQDSLTWDGTNRDRSEVIEFDFDPGVLTFHYVDDAGGQSASSVFVRGEWRWRK